MIGATEAKARAETNLSEEVTAAVQRGKSTIEVGIDAAVRSGQLTAEVVVKVTPESYNEATRQLLLWLKGLGYAASVSQDLVMEASDKPWTSHTYYQVGGARFLVRWSSAAGKAL